MFRKRERVSISFPEPSRTKQAFKDECDVNLILKKYQKTQLINHVNRTQGIYGDFSNVSDFHTATNAVMDAQLAFMDLPASIRKRFQNDPSQFIDFVSNDQNYGEAAELGLLTPEKTKQYYESKAPKPDSNSSTPRKASKNEPSKNDD